MIQYFRMRENHAVPALRATVLALFDTLEWRHHGIGMLQAYVSEQTMPEVRVHIFAPELVKVGISESGDIHDHRFDLVSHVLYGNVRHQEYEVEEDSKGEWAIAALTHARLAKDTGYHGPVRALEGRYSARSQVYTIREGYTYTFPKGRFHRSPVEGLAVSCVEKHCQSDVPARLLYPIDKPPVMAFGHSLDWSVVGPVIARAKEALLVANRAERPQSV
jgi:hypothetical protein